MLEENFTVAMDGALAPYQRLQLRQLFFERKAGIQYRHPAVHDGIRSFQRRHIALPVVDLPFIARIGAVDDALAAYIERQFQPDVTQSRGGRKAQGLGGKQRR